MSSTRTLLLAVAVALSPVANAANVDSIFYPAQGKVVLPHLKVGNAIYYVILRKVGTSNDFRLDAASVTNLSPPLSYTPASQAELIGNFR
jgi:hypothetical protein